MKKNLILIFSFLILSILFTVKIVPIIKRISQANQSSYQVYEKCISDDAYRLQHSDFCNKNTVYYETDFFHNYFEVVTLGMAPYVYLIPLFILIPSLLYVSKYLKNMVIKNELTRKKYVDIKKNLYKEAYKPLSIIILFIVVIVIVAIYSKGFESSYSIINKELDASVELWTDFYLYHSALLVIMQVILMLVHFILYINIGILILRKHHNYFVAILLSYLTLVGIEAILEIGINVIICNIILKNNYGEIFNIFNYLYFDNHISVVAPFVVPTILMIISFILIHFAYKNKEKLLIDCEAN